MQRNLKANFTEVYPPSYFKWRFKDNYRLQLWYFTDEKGDKYIIIWYEKINSFYIRCNNRIPIISKR